VFILNELKDGNFGQKPVKRGMHLQVLITKELEAAWLSANKKSACMGRRSHQNIIAWASNAERWLYRLGAGG